MLCLEIIHGNRQVPIAIADRIGLRSAVVDRQLEFEPALLIAQIDAA